MYVYPSFFVLSFFYTFNAVVFYVSPPFPPFFPLPVKFRCTFDILLLFLLGQVHIIFQENNAEEADWYYYIEE